MHQSGAYTDFMVFLIEKRILAQKQQNIPRIK